MTFEDWIKDKGVVSAIYTKEQIIIIAERAWDAGYFQAHEESNAGIVRLNKTIKILRNLREKYPERTIEDD